MKVPKKPSLGSISEKRFTKELRGLRHLPHQKIVNRLDSGFFSLDSNKVYNHRPQNLAAEEYKRCLTLFERRFPADNNSTQVAVQSVSQRLNQVITPYVSLKDMTHEDELKEIAVDTIRELFDIPEHLQFFPNIDSPDIEKEDKPDVSLSPEEKNSMWDEIQKRVILNGLVHGCAMHVWKSAHYIVKEKIDQLDTLLMPMYDEYIAAISWLIWQTDIDDFQSAVDSGDQMTQGFNSLEFDEEEPFCNVHCHAVNFPVLLHECAKGAMDYLICHAIPQDYTEEQLEYYYAKADAYENEPWHYLISPSIWTMVLEAADITNQQVPQLISNLCQLSYHELSEVVTSCIDNPGQGRLKLLQFKIV